MKSNKHWFRLSLSDVISLFGIAATVFLTLYFGNWGLKLSQQGIDLSRESLKQADDIAAQQQTIKGWDTLMMYQSKQDSSLKSEVSILTEQLSLNEIAQKEANKNFRFTESEGVSRLKIAQAKLSKTLQRVMPVYPSVALDSINKVMFLNESRDILELELNNRFLFGKDTLLKEWLDAYHSILNYESFEMRRRNLGTFGGSPAQGMLGEQNQQLWTDLFFKIQELQSNLFLMLNPGVLDKISNPERYKINSKPLIPITAFKNSKIVYLTTSPTTYYHSTTKNSYVTVQCYNTTSYPILTIIKIGQHYIDSVTVAGSHDPGYYNFRGHDSIKLNAGDSIVAYTNMDNAIKAIIFY